MKSFIYLILFSVIIVSGCSKKQVHVSGTLTNPENGEFIYLDEIKADKLEPVDSVKIGEDGTFNFKFDVDFPSFYILKFSERNFLTLLVEPGESITFASHHDSLNFPVTISGSKGTESMTEYNKTLRSTASKLSGLSIIYNQNTENPRLPQIIDSLDNLAQGYLKEINEYTRNYIDNNIQSLVSLVALYQQVAPGVPVLSPSADLQYFLKVDSALTKLYPDYPPVISLHEQISQFESFAQGEAPAAAENTMDAAPEIALPTPEGDTIKLSSTRGSVVLLDFWAAWCAPCRQENPNLVKAYNTYHKKGFQIYQVSLDKTKEAWVKGIEEDKLGRWIHVSDIKYWNSVVIPIYKIESIPSNFLLDKEGRIIATNLRGAQLEEKLAEIFNK